MSAFVVEDKTINRIVSFFALMDAGGAWYVRQFKEIGYNLEEAKDQRNLAQAMFELNCRAVDQRYAKGLARSEFHPEPFEFRLIFGASPIEIVKALRCWRYQCSEGDIPEHPLYKFMDGIIASMCETIVDKLPEYQEAYWG